MSTVSDWFRDFDAYGDIIRPLIDGGWLEFVFPFLLVYALVYTISGQIAVLSNKALRVILSLCFGLFAIAFPINDAGTTLGEMMSVLFPGVTAISVVILSVYILLALFGFDMADFFHDAKYQWVKYILGALALLLVLYYFAKGFGWDGFGAGGGSDIEDFLTDPGLYILILIVALLWFLSRDEDPEKIKARAEAAREMRAARRGESSSSSPASPPSPPSSGGSS